MKALSIILSLLMGIQPVLNACENIEPIDTGSIEYDPLGATKKILRTEGTLGDRAEEVGKALVKGLEYASDFFAVGGELANGFYIGQSIHDLDDAIDADDIQGAIMATVNIIASFSLPIIAEINPAAGLILGLTIFEAQAIMSIVEQSHAYQNILNRLHTYESELEERLGDIENRFISDIQYISLPQDQLHLTMADADNFIYRLIALNSGKRDVVSRLQDTVDTFCEGIIEFELQQAFDRNEVVDLPLLNSNQLFGSVVEMEHTVSEHINELREQIVEADFVAANGFLDKVNTKVIESLVTNLTAALPPIVEEMKTAVHSKSNLIEELSYETSRFGRISFLSSHLDWLESYIWLLFHHHFAQHPHLLGNGFINPAVSTTVLAASAYVPVVGLVLLAVASPAIGAKILSNDYALLQQILGLQNLKLYMDDQGASILRDSVALNAAVTRFVRHSHVHPFIAGDELIEVLKKGLYAAREEALLFLPHALDADIHSVEVGDAYVQALEHIEELKQTEGDTIRFALDPAIHQILPATGILGPMMTMDEAEDINVYFSGGMLEENKNLSSAKNWELIASNSPYQIVRSEMSDAAYFRVIEDPNENEITNNTENGFSAVSTDDMTDSMPGGITMEDGKIVVEAFVGSDSAYTTNVVYAHLDHIEDTLQEDLHTLIDMIANPQVSSNALSWIEDAKNEVIEEAAIEEGIRTVCGLITRQLIDFLRHSDRSADAFDELAQSIKIDWALHKDEVIVYLENEPVEYYQLDRIPGTQWVVDQYMGWAEAMKNNVASNGWNAMDRYPSELVDFINENDIEQEAVEKIVAGYGMRMKKNSEWSRSAQSKMVMGAFPREVLKNYAKTEGLDVDNLTYKYTFGYGFSRSVDGDGPTTWKTSDSVGKANIVERNQYEEADNFAMWPLAYWGQKSSPTFSVFYNLFSLLKARVASSNTGDVVLSDGEDERTVGFKVSSFCEDGSSSGGYTEVSAMKWNHLYECHMPVSIELLQLQDDSRFRGCVVEADLNLAEFIWMTRRRGYDHSQLNEVKIRAYVLNHQRYDHSLPHEGEDVKKSVDNDLVLKSEKVILDRSDLANYRSGILPTALTEPIKFHFNTTDTVPVHDKFEISNMKTYHELICLEVIFNGVTEYIFYPEQGEDLLFDESSLDDKKTANYGMYYYDYAPLQGGRIQQFNSYSISDLEDLSLPAIIEDFQ
jgi:hypothetical protein